VSQSVTHWIQYHLSFFFHENCVPRVPNMINYIFSPKLQLSNGNWPSLQNGTRPYVNGFPLGFCDHSTKHCVGCHHISLMEKDPKYELVDCWWRISHLEL
jgi:hypothetical protein